MEPVDRERGATCSCVFTRRRKPVYTNAMRLLPNVLAGSLLAVLACGPPPSPDAPPPPLPVSSTPSPSPTTAPAAGGDTSDDAAIAAAEKAYIDLVVEIMPESATALGLHANDGSLDDRSAAGQAKIIAREKTMLQDLEKRFANAHASKSARVDLAILEGTLRVDVRWREEIRPQERLPDFYTQPMNAIFLMTARDYAPAAERAKNVLTRLEKLPGLLAGAKTELKNPPRIWTQVGIEAADGAKSFFDEQKAPLESALPDQKPRIATALDGAKKAYADYKRYLEKDVLPRSTGNFAVGKPFFEWLLHENYFLDEDSAALQALGQKILEQTEKQLDEVAKKIDPKAKAWFEVAAKVKSKHPTAADLLTSYRKEVARARQFLVDKDAVSFPAGDSCEVIETPAFQRSTVTAAYDQPPPFDPVTKGLFFVTPVEKGTSAAKAEAMLREHDYADQVNTAVHETYPGHHLQLSFARTSPSLIRKATGPSIFSEGWGLYSEEVMSELGYYTDEQRLMQLEWTLVRAARVLIDIGLQTQGMTFDDAVKILTDRVHLEKPLAASEVKRYTESPTQPLSYLVGREMIFKLRSRYEQREKERFTLKRFHTELLSHGTIAPGLLAREMFD